MTFTEHFYKHIMFRHSCGVCHFTNLKRPSDITLADFWGWEKNAPGMNDDNKGLSLVLVNTEKGKEIFDLVKSRIDSKDVDVDNCLQPNLQHPSIIHPDRMKFEQDYIKKGFKFVINRDYDKSLIGSYLYHLLRSVKQGLRKIIKSN